MREGEKMQRKKKIGGGEYKSRSVREKLKTRKFLNNSVTAVSLQYENKTRDETCERIKNKGVCEVTE